MWFQLGTKTHSETDLTRQFVPKGPGTRFAESLGEVIMERLIQVLFNPKELWIWLTSALSFFIILYMGFHFELSAPHRRAIALEKVDTISQNQSNARRFEISGTRSE